MSNICSFVGDRYISNNIILDDYICKAVFDVIENKDTDTFYISNGGDFNKRCINYVLIAKEKYPNIKLILVTNRIILQNIDIYDDIIVLNKRTTGGDELVDCRKWMIEHSNIIIHYDIRRFSKINKHIESKEKEIIELRWQYKSDFE